MRNFSKITYRNSQNNTDFCQIHSLVFRYTYMFKPQMLPTTKLQGWYRKLSREHETRMFLFFHENGINFFIQILITLLCSTSSLPMEYISPSERDCQWFKLQQGYPIIQIIWYDISFKEIKLISMPFFGEL